MASVSFEAFTEIVNKAVNCGDGSLFEQNGKRIRIMPCPNCSHRIVLGECPLDQRELVIMSKAVRVNNYRFVLR